MCEMRLDYLFFDEVSLGFNDKVFHQQIRIRDGHRIESSS
jgi:hypothetical protein